MIKVVRVITWLPVGGIERRLVAVLPRLRAEGFDPEVVCIREEGPLAAELKAAGVPVTVIPFRSRLSPVGIMSLALHFSKVKAQVVHSHMYRANVPSAIAGRIAGTPVVFGHLHNVGSWDGKRQEWMDRVTAPWRTATFAVSQAVQRDGMAVLRLPAERVPVLYNGIDTEQFRPQPELRAAGRAALGLAAEDIAVLVPARLHPQKNPEGVLKAFAEAVGENPRAVLLFAGDGPLAEKLPPLVPENLRSRVRFLGSRDDMPALYNAADVMVLSSFKEGFSNAIIEALACGCPVIASDVGGNREAIDRPAIGWIHSAGDHAGLVAQLVEATAGGVSGLRERAAACRARALDFSLDALVRQTAQHYRSALAAKGLPT